MFVTARHQASRLGRAVALGLSALVLLLAVLAVCPAAHEWLHPDAGHEDHECAITLFAHGITAAFAGVALAGVAWRLIRLVFAGAAEWDLAAPRFRLLPGRAPPVG
jgi:hypothetical protein